MKRISEVVLLAIGLVTASNIVLAARYFMLRSELQAASEKPVSIPPLSGVELSGRHWASRDAPCHVLRITADECPHCKADRVSYDKLVQTAVERGCEVIEVAPRAGDLSDAHRPELVQLKYVDVDLGLAVVPYVTPHTLVLDRNWAVRWKRRGELSDQTAIQGSNAILSIPQ
jgi:hypothetical protein